MAVGGWLTVDALTVTGALNRKPSLTMSCAVYVPSASAVNVGFTAVALDTRPRCPRASRADQAYVSPWFSGSVEPLPSSCTSCGTDAMLTGLIAAAAVGLTFVLVTVSVLGAPLTKPSLTTSCATKLPGA